MRALRPHHHAIGGEVIVAHVQHDLVFLVPHTLRINHHAPGRDFAAKVAPQALDTLRCQFARACCFAEFDPWLRSATRDVLRFSLPAQAGIRGYARSPPEPSGETVNTTRKPQYPKPATAKQLLGHASVSQRNDTCSRACPLNGQMNTSVPRRRTTSHPYSKGPKSLEVRRKFGPCGLQECAEMVPFR